MRIVVDAMGGDFAPAAVVEGALAALRQYGIEIVLIGQKEPLDLELAKYSPLPHGLSVEYASEVVRMDEPAASVVRKKRDSSIVKGIELVREKKADAFVSAGNTGAVACAAVLFLGMLPGVERPGIAITIPTLKGMSVFIDAGANIDPKPVHLLQYGLMVDAYFKFVLEKPNPTIGLLNVGAEETKGTDFVKEAYQLLEKAKINFIGNVEGRDIYMGTSDCIVCDGFVGNVTLKVSEGLIHAIMELLRRELKKSVWGLMSAPLLKLALSNFKKNMDYSEYGGAPLLGVDGVVIIGHGHSNSNAIKNAIRVAVEEVKHDINGKIIEAIKTIT